MGKKLLYSACLLVLVSCSKSASNRLSDAVSYYDVRRYDISLKLLDDEKPSDKIDAITSEMYLARAFITRDKKLAAKAMPFIQAIADNQRLDVDGKQFVNYLYSVYYDVMDNKVEARRVFEQNCRLESGMKYNACVPVDELTRGSLNQVGYEFSYSVNSVGIKNMVGDPSLYTAQMTSAVLMDYGVGHELKNQLVKKESFGATQKEAYCSALSERRQYGSTEKLEVDDIKDCGLTK